jgi:hypothetical protein
VAQRTPDNPLTRLILRQMSAQELRPTELWRKLSARGVMVTQPAISAWLSGGGVSDRHRPALAELLGIDLLHFQQAAALRDQQVNAPARLSA